jgi:hypothetical protein
MKKLEKIFSKKLQKDIILEFKISDYRVIQFADLAVGVYRREDQKKSCCVCFSE